MRGSGRQQTACRAGVFLVLVLGAAVGCGDGASGFVPVSGRVTVDGQPLTAGAVSFRPDADKGNHTLHHPTGELGADGRYELYTVGKKGAPPGKYRVLVFAPEAGPAGTQTAPVIPKWRHHGKYTSESSSDLFREVVETPAAGAYDLKLTR